MSIRELLVAGVATAVLLGGALPARADWEHGRDGHWRGGHDWHEHEWHGGGWYGGGWRPIYRPWAYAPPPPVYYAPPPVYYAPPPVYYARPPAVFFGFGVP